MAALDQDSADKKHTFAVRSPNESFTISGSGILVFTGKGQGIQGIGLDYEQAATVHVVVRVTDAKGAFNDVTVTVKITDANDVPHLARHTIHVSEAVRVGQIITGFSIVDEDCLTNASWLRTRQPQTHTVKLLASADSTNFKVNGSTLLLNRNVDYEVRTTYQIKVLVTDSGFNPRTIAATIAVRVLDAPELPVLVTLSHAVVNETSAFSDTKRGTEIGEVALYDEDLDEDGTGAMLVISTPSSSVFGVKFIGCSNVTGAAAGGKLTKNRKYVRCRAMLVVSGVLNHADGAQQVR